MYTITMFVIFILFNGTVEATIEYLSIYVKTMKDAIDLERVEILGYTSSG